MTKEDLIMNDLQGFVQTAAKDIGISSDTSSKATGGILNLIKDQAGEADFGKLVGSLPGAAALLSQGKGSGGGGLLGSLGGAVSGSLGGKLGGAASVMGIFQKSGLNMDQAGKFVSMFFNFAKDKAGSDLVGQILGKMPDVKKLIG
jgi:hypothetical protein